MKRALARFKPADINLTILIKYVSDFSSFLKKISPFSSLVFIILNYRHLIYCSRKTVTYITLALLLPAFLLTPTPEILRLIFSAGILWIFLEKFDRPDREFSMITASVIILYAVVIFAGIFNPDYYLVMGGGAFRYKFILESHNALSVLVLISFTYLLNALLEQPSLSWPRWFRVLLFGAIILFSIEFLFIKSRLYIGLSLALLILVSLQKWKTRRSLAVLPAVYLGLFLFLTQLNLSIKPPVSVVEEIADSPGINIAPDSSVAIQPRTVPSKTRKRRTHRVLITDSVQGKKVLEMIDNNRVMSLSGTGRWQMIQAFREMFRELGWKKFIYQNNTKDFFERKSKLPGIDVRVSTLTENTYLVILLNTGFLGLAVFLFIFGYYIIHFYNRKEYFSLLYFLLMMATWFFEETVMFPFSMITHLFALGTINRLERTKYENSTGH